jgi:hypothetical protein
MLEIDAYQYFRLSLQRVLPLYGALFFLSVVPPFLDYSDVKGPAGIFNTDFAFIFLCVSCLYLGFLLVRGLPRLYRAVRRLPEVGISKTSLMIDGSNEISSSDIVEIAPPKRGWRVIRLSTGKSIGIPVFMFEDPETLTRALLTMETSKESNIRAAR